MKSTILIIEDNKQNMYMLSYLLENNGYNVLKAYNGARGLKIAHEKHPEIILIDIQLPDMDGYEICIKLRHNGLPKNTTIIAVTSYAMGGDKEKAIEAGADGYIEKPINPETFVSQMEKIHNTR
ncbi:response regulator [Algibacter luteus]|uniref:CheY chemotaxis protein or a CheY-like REC (Receiver) domain n=1 Tax=Algibacter luteus TaxID=1178825 RepID=A0A1M6AQP5_9FLAO|nr:response regulator [Algibacter luteus]WJJ97408.1 response regulator [Algibacter luteus]SHI38648.1 CheY chemotaxis protein or a CheY-like REC (receiver) domain [Algibacter luteus]